MSRSILYSMENFFEKMNSFSLFLYDLKFCNLILYYCRVHVKTFMTDYIFKNPQYYFFLNIFNTFS